MRCNNLCKLLLCFQNIVGNTLFVFLGSGIGWGRCMNVLLLVYMVKQGLYMFLLMRMRVCMFRTLGINRSPLVVDAAYC